MASAAQPRPRSALVGEEIVLTLFDLANHLQKRGERIARRGGLTTREWLLLLQVSGDPSFPGGPCHDGRAGGPLPSAIAEARGVSRANISGLLRSLLRRGLVRQVAGARDRRQRGLRLTGKGRRALSAIQPVRRRANRLLLARLGAAERRRLRDSLRTCLGTVLEEREEAYL